MITGRPRKTDAEKKVKGTYRPSRSNPLAPQVPKEIPPIPARIAKDKLASDFYMRTAQHLHKMRVITIHDEIALEHVALMYRDMVELETEISNSGRTYKSHTKNGTSIKTRPEVQQLLEIRRQFTNMLQQFGLTPATRDKVNADVPVQGDLFADFANQAPKLTKVS